MINPYFYLNNSTVGHPTLKRASAWQARPSNYFPPEAGGFLMYPRLG
ncbi:MAG: hypothetical protein WC575_01570 [Patescibacteria group bacterium]